MARLPVENTSWVSLLSNLAPLVGCALDEGRTRWGLLVFFFF